MSTIGNVLELSYKEQGTVVNEIPWEENPRDGEIYFIKNNDTTYLTHGMHKYPSKYIPQIPRWAILNFIHRNQIERPMILDPFCGSGTTLLEAALQGIDSIGIDLDPLGCLVSRVKTRPLPEEDLNQLLTRFWHEYETARPDYQPDIENISHWFQDQNLETLSRLYSVIGRFADRPELYEFLLVTFSSIIRKASNADERSLKTYVSHTHPKSPRPAEELFRVALEKNIRNISKIARSIPEGTSTEVFGPLNSSQIGDFDFLRERNSFDCIISSPPYVKSMDYLYNQMLEVLWLGQYLGIPNKARLNECKKRYIGSQVRGAKYIPSLGVQNIDNFIQKIQEKSTKHAAITAQYFEDMSKHLEIMHSLLKPGGEYFIVVGNSKVSNLQVPVNQFIKELAIGKGFRVNFEIGYIIRKHYMIFPRVKSGGLIDTDWIINLVKQ